MAPAKKNKEKILDIEFKNSVIQKAIVRIEKSILEKENRIKQSIDD